MGTEEMPEELVGDEGIHNASISVIPHRFSSFRLRGKEGIKRPWMAVTLLSGIAQRRKNPRTWSRRRACMNGKRWVNLCHQKRYPSRSISSHR